MVDADIAWAAGIFEGEGSFIINGRHTKYPRLQMQMSMRDRDIVYRFFEVVGEGTVRPRKRAQPNWSDLWAWRATSAPAERVAAMLEPWLGERRTARLHELRLTVAEMRAHGTARLW